jgi:hypothetical protein
MARETASNSKTHPFYPLAKTNRLTQRQIVHLAKKVERQSLIFLTIRQTFGVTRHNRHWHISCLCKNCERTKRQRNGARRSSFTISSRCVPQGGRDERDIFRMGNRVHGLCVRSHVGHCGRAVVGATVRETNQRGSTGSCHRYVRTSRRLDRQHKRNG